MAQYITRVELHDAVWSDYAKLHEAMRREGFSQTITANDGAVYELPPAEYNYIGQETRAQVHDKAKRTARTIKPSFAVLVTEAVGITWSGLKLLKAAAA
jgi:Endoribonuclease GhoS